MLNSFLVRFKMSWAGRSAWNDRSVGIAEAAGSNPVPSTLMSALSFLFGFYLKWRHHLSCKLVPFLGLEDYSIMKMFLLRHISLSIFGHTETLTSPMWAFLSITICVRDCPIPPPMLRGILSLMMA